MSYTKKSKVVLQKSHIFPGESNVLEVLYGSFLLQLVGKYTCVCGGGGVRTGLRTIPCSSALSVSLHWHSPANGGCPVARGLFLHRSAPSTLSNCYKHSVTQCREAARPPEIAQGVGWSQTPVKSCGAICPPITQTAGRRTGGGFGKQPFATWDITYWADCCAAVTVCVSACHMHIVVERESQTEREHPVASESALDHEAERGVVFRRALWGFGSCVHPTLLWNRLLAAGLRELPPKPQQTWWPGCDHSGGCQNDYRVVSVGNSTTSANRFNN